MVEANQRGWNVISLKNGWKKIFAFEKQESAMNANGAVKVSVAAIDKETTMNIHSDGLAAALSGFSPARVVICALLSSTLSDSFSLLRDLRLSCGRMQCVVIVQSIHGVVNDNVNSNTSIAYLAWSLRR